MIAFLRGSVYKKDPRALVLEVNGVGYRVFCPLSVLATVPDKGSVFLHIHHHVREEEISLFGFLRSEDLHLFEKLISVSGIGPKTALDILEVPPRLIHDAIEQSDVNFLKSLKGVGKKTAERLVLELKGALPMLDDGGVNLAPEVLEALADLGFERVLIQRAFQALKEPLKTSEEMVKWFLQNHAR